MSDHRSTATSESAEGGRPPARRGQTLVEFALVLPMLLVLLLGIADFGRVFAAGITLEAMARNAAEAAAQDYLQVRRQSAALTSPDFDRVHAVAMASICNEADPLPNKVQAGGTCTMPAAAVCIHDNATELAAYGSRCGQEAGAAPAECTQLHSGWPATAPGADQLPWVEVRVCYKFETLFDLTGLQLPFGWGLSIGDVWLEKNRTFTVADY